MKIKDMVHIAFQNILAGKQMIKRMIFGIVFVIMILFCFLMILESYYEYIRIFNERNKKDCYYYTEISEQNISNGEIADVLSGVEENIQKFHANEASILCIIQIKNCYTEVNARNTCININGENYVATNYYVGKRKIYQDISGPLAPIWFALYKEDFSVFADTITSEYSGSYMIGEYPINPGEIMIDTYILDVYGIAYDEGLLGSEISIYVEDDYGKEILFDSYKITGIFQGDILEERESATTKDNHIEHIYVSPRIDDIDSYYILYGSIRYYFNDYSSFVENYKYMRSLLQMDIDKVKDVDVKLTGKGMECYILYWMANNVGKLLLLISLVICIIITASVLYIFQFYRNRNATYISMLKSIGMTKRDRKCIFFIEISIAIIVASIIGVYLSVVFILLFNVITQQVLNFYISIEIKTAIVALLGSWAYFGLCFGCIMKEKNGV